MRGALIAVFPWTEPKMTDVWLALSRATENHVRCIFPTEQERVTEVGKATRLPSRFSSRWLSPPVSGGLCVATKQRFWTCQAVHDVQLLET